MKRIILTGGGTAGHVTPNIALVPKLKEKGYDIQYIGSYDGIERKLIEDLKISYYGIASGKLRRYFDIKNFSDPFRVIKGYGQAVRLMKKLKPSVVFSKGGFVAVPVVMAAKHCHIPVVIHESDLTPGLANKLSIPSATKVCCNFPETISHIPDGKAVLTGSPIRQELLKGNRLKALDFCGFTADKPVLLVIGGSQGSVIVNDSIRGILPELLKTFQVIHLCGKGKLDPTLNYMDGYVQYEYVFFQSNPARIEKLTGAAATCCNVRNRFVKDLLGIRNAGINVRYANTNVIVFESFRTFASSTSGLISVLYTFVIMVPVANIIVAIVAAMIIVANAKIIPSTPLTFPP